MENNLPEGWIELSPLDISEKIRGVSYDKSEVSFQTQSNYLPVLRANNISDNKIIFSDLVYVLKDRISSQQILQKGDVVIAMSSGSISVVGKTAQIITDWEGSFGAFCGVLRPFKAMNSGYFGYYFQSKEYSEVVRVSRTHFSKVKSY